MAGIEQARGHPVRKLRSNPPLSTQFAERLLSVHTARQAPVEELCDINPALSDFTLVNPHVVGAEFCGQLALRKSRFLSHLAQHRRKMPVARGVLGLGHNPYCPADFSCYRFDNILGCCRPRQSMRGEG